MAVETDARKAGYAVLGDGYHIGVGEDLQHASSGGGCWESMIMGVQSGREGAGGGNAIACTACGLTFFPACPLEGDAMRAALERMRGGGGDFYRRVLGSRAARSQRRQNTAGAQLRRVFAKYCESGGVSGALRGSSGASILPYTAVGRVKG